MLLVFIIVPQIMMLTLLGMPMNNNMPSIKITPSKEFPVEYGDTLDLTCEVEGAGRGYQVTWSKLGQSELGDGVIARGNMVRIQNLNSGHAGLYRCSVRTRYGTPYTDYNLSVTGIV